MMKIKLKRWLLLLLILSFATPVFARAVTLIVRVNNEGGTAIGSGKAVQVIQPSCLTSPTASEYLATGSLKMDETPPGTFIRTNANSYVSRTETGPDQYLSQGTGAAVLRIWNGSTPSAVITAQGYYGYFSYDLGGVTDSPIDKPGTATTNYQAKAPDAPTIGTISVAYVEKEEQLVGYASIPISANTTRYEMHRTSEGPAYEVRIRPQGSSSWTIEKGSDSSSISTDPNVVAERLALGLTFEVQACCRSYFGTSPWSSSAYFKTAGILAAGGAAGPVTYYLQKIPEGLGLNAVSVVHEVPFNVDTDPATEVGTIADLVRAINTKSTSPNNVTAIGWMEESAMKGFFVTYPDGRTATYTPTGGIAADANIPLKRGESYQISVNSSVEVTFSQ